MEQGLEIHQFDAMEGCLLGGHVGVHAEKVHLETTGPVGDGHPDLPEPDDPQGPASQLDALELGSLPFATADGGVGRGDLAGEAQQQGKRVFRRSNRVAGRRVDDGDPGSRGGIQVHVVHADTGAPDDLETCAGGNHLRVGLHLAPHDQRVELADDCQEARMIKSEPLVDIVGGPEESDALGRDGFGDQDPHTGAE